MPEDKTLNGRNVGVVWKYAVGAASAALVLATFYYAAERGQDKEMRDQGKELVKATTALSQHLEASKEESREMRDTMREQRTSSRNISITLVGLQARQEALVAKDVDICKRLDEIRNRRIVTP
jgi:septal ring factor EnvC (AmiA/AmiB activator)